MNASSDFIDANIHAGRGGTIAVVDVGGSRELTYADVGRGVNRTGHALRRLGMRPEERVVALLPD